LLFDLFSFDVPGGSGDMKAEIIDLFAAKLLNFIRNPFCIEKVLNSFPGVASYDPTDPALLGRLPAHRERQEAAPGASMH
jgi:hypothetical protein